MEQVAGDFGEVVESGVVTMDIGLASNTSPILLTLPVTLVTCAIERVEPYNLLTAVYWSHTNVVSA